MATYTVVFIAWLKLITVGVETDNTYNYLFTTTRYIAPIGNYYIAHSQLDIIDININAFIKVHISATCHDAHQIETIGTYEFPKRIAICNATNFTILDKQYD
jgi:hypothetical protein